MTELTPRRDTPQPPAVAPDGPAAPGLPAADAGLLPDGTPGALVIDAPDTPSTLIPPTTADMTPDAHFPEANTTGDPTGPHGPTMETPEKTGGDDPYASPGTPDQSIRVDPLSDHERNEILNRFQLFKNWVRVPHDWQMKAPELIEPLTTLTDILGRHPDWAADSDYYEYAVPFAHAKPDEMSLVARIQHVTAALERREAILATLPTDRLLTGGFPGCPEEMAFNHGLLPDTNGVVDALFYLHDPEGNLIPTSSYHISFDVSEGAIIIAEAQATPKVTDDPFYAATRRNELSKIMQDGRNLPKTGFYHPGHLEAVVLLLRERLIQYGAADRTMPVIIPKAPEIFWADDAHYVKRRACISRVFRQLQRSNQNTSEPPIALDQEEKKCCNDSSRLMKLNTLLQYILFALNFGKEWRRLMSLHAIIPTP